MRRRVMACAGLLATALAAGSADAQTGSMETAVARDLADTLVKDVETEALRPADPAKYEAAKHRLYDVVNAGAPQVDRARVYDAARRLLWTLDTDGHTILWSREQTATWEASTSPAAAAAPQAVRPLRTANGIALVLRPPQTTFMDDPQTKAYASDLIRGIERAMVSPAPCAVVVDLSDQKGGNAWPALAVLGALTTASNSAQYVDRDAHRTPVFGRDAYSWIVDQLGNLPPNPLLRFAGTPPVVVTSRQTASAGEMIAVILKGEAGSRAFGEPTYGMTSANKVVPLPDGATVLLTTYRYAFGDAPAVRGKLLPDVPIDSATSLPNAAVDAAAAWATSHAPGCRGGS